MLIYSPCLYIAHKNVIKMENSHLAIFDKIWPTTLYYSTGFLSYDDFEPF